jgi:hypothetical protein
MYRKISTTSSFKDIENSISSKSVQLNQHKITVLLQIIILHPEKRTQVERNLNPIYIVHVSSEMVILII